MNHVHEHTLIHIHWSLAAKSENNFNHSVSRENHVRIYIMRAKKYREKKRRECFRSTQLVLVCVANISDKKEMTSLKKEDITDEIIFLK